MSTIIKTLPSSMVNVAKPGMATVTQGAGGKQTIVIAAPKASVTGTPGAAKIITTMPKISTATTSGTQFIVVTTRPGGTTSMAQGATVSTLPAGISKICLGYAAMGTWSLKSIVSTVGFASVM